MIDDVSDPGSYADKFRYADFYYGGLPAAIRREKIMTALQASASQLARHGAEQRRDKIVTKAKAIAERMNRPDLVERLTR